MASLTEYYGKAKEGFGEIDPKEAAQLGEDYLIVAATGAALGLTSAALGGLDHQIFGINVPVDGLASIGLGVAGLSMGGQTGAALKIASIAAGGSAAVRTFQGFFKSGFGVKGEFEELGSSASFGGLLTQGSGMGFGSNDDALVQAAKYL